MTEADIEPSGSLVVLSADGAVADDGPRTLKVGWDGVVLICRQCQKRSSGPSKLKGKQVAKAIKGAARSAKRSTRIAFTGCLGPCPRKAITVAATVPGAHAVRAWAVATEREADGLAGRLFTPEIA